MFDTLYGTKSFQPKPFCQFLVKSGEKALAEEIALSAIEKSRGQGEHVSFVLEELLYHSDDPEELLKAVNQLLVGTEHQSGKDVLFQWNLQHGYTDKAFGTALLITDEGERVKCALPLAILQSVSEGGSHWSV